MDEIPEGLEDLLNSIRGEGKSQQSSALAVIPNAVKQETELVDDEIDERILALLGLENINDIDYATYKTLLREKMMEGRMSGTEMPTEEVELLTDEFKRVKSATGRFKVKRKKINVGSFFETAQQKTETTTAEVEPAGALVKNPMVDLQGPQIVDDLEEEQEKDDKSDQFIRNVLAPSLNKIEENLESILETVTKQFKFDKKESEKAADAAQTTKKKTREKKREAKVKGGVKGVASKVVKPVKGLFDMILDFFKNILLGGALLWLVNFLQNPAKAIQPFIDVLDNIIKFVNSVIKTIFDFIFAPINAAISSIWDGLGGLEDTLNNLLSMIPRFGQDPIEPLDNINEENKPKFEAPQRTDEEGNYIPLENPFGDPEANQPLVAPATTETPAATEAPAATTEAPAATTEAPAVTPPATTEAPVQGQTQGGMVLNVNGMAFTQGGPIKEDSGVNITGMGKDTQLIAAQPGEVMMSRPAVQMIGAENLLAANAAAGSSNKPKMGMPRIGGSSMLGMPPIMGAFTNGGSVTNTMSPITNLGYTSGGSVTNSSTSPLNVSNFRYEGGGSITGSSGQTVTGMGPDTQLIATQPGEIVMSKKAVQSYGANNLLAMNRDAGGTNIPTMGSVQGFSGGGMIFDPKDPMGSLMRINQQMKETLPSAQSFPGASPLLQSPATQMFQPQSPVIPSGPKRISGANYDVILPLDHTKKPGTIPDTPGGNTFTNSNATGADGREREHQDKAASLVGKKLTDMGLRVKIMTPEEYPSYQDYDKALATFASKGIKIVPLHFDAIRGAGGVGFLTRTKAGDAGDARLASPIQQALSEFQSANPELGNISSDTMGNATINRAAKTDAALVELGVMVDWENRYGPDFTQSAKFDQLATSVSKAIFKGGGFGTPPVSGTVQTTPLVSPTEQSTTMSSSPQALQAPAMRVSPTTGLLIPPGPPGQRQTNVIMAGVGGQQRLNSGPTSAAMASQKRLPAISPIDGGNNEMIVIKSIYNIVG